MPAISKDLPPKKPTAAPTGSILSQAVDVGELEDLFIKMCIYGRNRIGKTTLACQFPKPLLLVAMEPSPTGGARSVMGMPGINVIRVTHKALIDPTTKKREKIWGSKKAILLAKELQADCPYKTVVIDTATSYQDIILSEIMGLSDVPEMLSWGLVDEGQYRQRSEKTRECLRPFLDLRCHVIVIAQEKDHNPPEGRISKIIRPAQEESFFAADLGGATAKWLQDNCDYVCQLFQDREIKEVPSLVAPKKDAAGNKIPNPPTLVDTGQIVRRLRTMYHPNYSAGFRSANPDAVPEYIQAAKPDEMYAAVMQVMQGIKLTKNAKYAKVDE